MEFQGHSISAASLATGSHEPATEYGQRAYRVMGPDIDVVYWALENGWSGIISVIPHGNDESHIIAFWNRLMDIAEEEE